jgi:(S)-2-hydroxyglutarate dehydrogenase
MKKQIIIAGGGILGLSIAYQLTNRYKNLNILILEKENNISQHQSSRNSGVLHCGYQYEPESFKARLSKRGYELMINFAKENNIEYELTGKIIVANDEMEIKNLDKTFYNSKKNGYSKTKFINEIDLKKLEPNVKSKKTLFVNEEGIIDYQQVCLKLKNKILDSKNNKILLNKKVIKLNNKNTLITSEGDEFKFDFFFNAAGLYSDKLLNEFTYTRGENIIMPVRGEYLVLKKEHRNIFNGLIYQAPDPNFPFLGVHLTKKISGEKLLGPSAILAFKKEGYYFKDFNIKELFDLIKFPGFGKFLKGNKAFIWDELLSSLSRKIYLDKAKKIIPDLNQSMFLNKKFSGVRAQSLNNNGRLLMDFSIKSFNNQLHIINYPSPGATSSLGFAEFLIDKYFEGRLS